MRIGNISGHLILRTVSGDINTTGKGGEKSVSRFHSDDELREMEEHPGEMSKYIGRTKPYECSYPVMVERPRIPERSKDGKNSRA